MAEHDEKHSPVEVPVLLQEQEGFLTKSLRYAITRLPTLIPPMNPAPNPFKALLLLNLQQWLFFLVGGI